MAWPTMASEAGLKYDIVEFIQNRITFHILDTIFLKARLEN